MSLDKHDLEGLRLVHLFLQTLSSNFEEENVTINGENLTLIVDSIIEKNTPSEDELEFKLVKSNPTIKDAVIKLKQEKDRITKRLHDILNSLVTIQSLCDHEDCKGKSVMTCTGGDSHKKYYKCDICGWEN